MGGVEGRRVDAMKGIYGRALKIDMSEQGASFEDIPEELFQRHLGGKGLATRVLLENNPPGVDPLSAENHLIFSIGPLVGTPVAGSCRYGVFTKSPQTGFYAESYSGGTVADYMARTGSDLFMIRGESDKPVWLEISEEGVQFHDASELWGTETYETEARLKGWMNRNRPDVRNCGAICIGPAGENKVAFAVIENDRWRCAGRTGVGAVMGAKKIKGMVFWGNRRKETAHPELVRDFVKGLYGRAKDDKGVNAYKTLGTPQLVDIANAMGTFPSRYWHKGTVDFSDQINAPALHDRCEVVPKACLKCFMACGRLSTVKQGRHKGLKIEGPEYETIYALGGLCEVAEIEEIAYLNDICDRLGIDTMSAGNLAAFAMEAFERGKSDYEIRYGDTDRVAELLQDITYRRGIGDVLAKGIKHAAREWGMEDVAIHVKGLEPAGYDPRVLKGMGLAYGTSPRGACHLRTTFYKPELAGMIDPDQIEGKARMFAEWEDRLTVFDSLVLCRFYRDLYQWEELAEMMKGVTGLDLDREGMRSIAGAISDDTRRFNIREGLTQEDDELPKRFHEEALPEKGKIITREEYGRLLKEYYEERGWDEMGRPRDLETQ